MSAVENTVSKQVSDDHELLMLMLSNMNTADPIYQPTNFWKLSNDLLLPELEQLGLKDYRRRKNTRLGGFAANDPNHNLVDFDLRKLRYVNNRLVRKIPGWQTLLDKLSSYLGNAVRRRADFTDEFVYDMCWEFCRGRGVASKHANPLETVGESLAGNPGEFFTTEAGKHFTLRFLNYYLRYAFVSQKLDLDNLGTYVELGCGAGRQVEILKKLHPDMTYLLFDIPPQIYVAERYLSTVFPGEVVSYRDTHSFRDLDSLQKGKIHIFGSWQFPLLKDFEIDLFWNAASMQEMEPDVVMNYLSIINQSANHVFLEAVMHGHHVASRPGAPGVIEKTTSVHYKTGLSDFEIVEQAPTITCFGTAMVSTSADDQILSSDDTLWSRKA